MSIARLHNGLVTHFALTQVNLVEIISLVPIGSLFINGVISLLKRLKEYYLVTTLSQIIKSLVSIVSGRWPH